MWYENFFAACWVLLQFIFWIACVVIALALLGMLVVGLWNAIRKHFPKREPGRETMHNNAHAAAISRYRLASDHVFVSAFVEGADYMWDALHRKK